MSETGDVVTVICWIVGNGGTHTFKLQPPPLLMWDAWEWRDGKGGEAVEVWCNTYEYIFMFICIYVYIIFVYTYA